jgi:hypothetical protein
MFELLLTGKDVFAQGSSLDWREVKGIIEHEVEAHNLDQKAELEFADRD